MAKGRFKELELIMGVQKTRNTGHDIATIPTENVEKLKEQTERNR